MNKPEGLDQWLAENGYIIVDVARLDADLAHNKKTKNGHFWSGMEFVVEQMKDNKYSPQEQVVVDEKCLACKGEGNETMIKVFHPLAPRREITCRTCNGTGNKDSKGGEV